jgi:hypothetical protein
MESSKPPPSGAIAYLKTLLTFGANPAAGPWGLKRGKFLVDN